MRKMSRDQAFKVVKIALSLTYGFSDFHEFEHIEVDKDVALENSCLCWSLNDCIYVDFFDLSIAITFTDTDRMINCYRVVKNCSHAIGFKLFNCFPTDVTQLVLCAQFVNYFRSLRPKIVDFSNM